MSDEKTSETSGPSPMTILINSIAWKIGLFAKVGEPPKFSGLPRPGVLNMFEVTHMILDMIINEEPVRQSLTALLGAYDPLRHKIGDKAADDLLAGRAAVVPLAGINPSTGQTVVLDELVYSNKKSVVYTAAERVRMDLDGVRIDAV